jgi:hypothetical protein
MNGIAPKTTKFLTGIYDLTIMHMSWIKWKKELMKFNFGNCDIYPHRRRPAYKMRSLHNHRFSGKQAHSH